MGLVSTFLCGVGIDKETLSSTAQALGCRHGEFLFTYLGVPVGANMPLPYYLGGGGGGLTLIKYVLGGLPTFYMTFFKASLGMIDQIE
uniref:Uncharacterized protein n=1 Tax=Lactuca sativa TaxID=4236 RepID=A0A9R1XP10_LACSA|nr:hypothetical protein LSAT_V11C200089590 [Lactuca sativa]